ncbi:MAG: H(+)/Cl(-) exchange transporter ClcA [Candidatus Sumerlaeaceae bacterium]|nr:H(+)/Cl(-) exchange transporter ClcA [Candidatus Sumerlaeaceae bacterium]
MVGLLAGLIAVAFQVSLEFAEQARDTLVARIPGSWVTHLGLSALICGILTGVAALMTHRYCPDAAGSGIPSVKGIVLGFFPFPWLRVIVVKFVGGCLSLGAGLSMGREGPTVHLGAAVARGLAHWLKLPLRSHRVLIAAGAGAGLAAAFNAPLAGFLFVIEEISGELTPVTYGTALIACVVADAVHRLLLGQGSAFSVVGHVAPQLGLLPLVVVLGALLGGFGVLFNRALLKCTVFSKRLPWWRAVPIGVISGVILVNWPMLSGGGNRTAEAVLNGHFQAGVLVFAGLIAGKLVFTCLSYSASVPGGIFAPMLLMGALFGHAFAIVCTNVTGYPLDPTVFALLGMAAFLTASTRALITGTVLIVEMTGSFSLLYAVILASLSAYLVAEMLREISVYDSLLDDQIRAHPSSQLGTYGPALTEVFVEPGSLLDGRQIDDLPSVSKSALVSVLRGENEFPPPLKMHLRAGDVVVFVMETNHAATVHELHLLGRA